MDAASEAYNSGAESVVAVDIQKPAAFGEEMRIAMAKELRRSGPNLQTDMIKRTGNFTLRMAHRLMQTLL